jgi:hypothetical protein
VAALRRSSTGNLDVSPPNDMTAAKRILMLNFTCPPPVKVIDFPLATSRTLAPGGAGGVTPRPCPEPLWRARQAGRAWGEGPSLELGEDGWPALIPAGQSGQPRCNAATLDFAAQCHMSPSNACPSTPQPPSPSSIFKDLLIPAFTRPWPLDCSDNVDVPRLAGAYPLGASRCALAQAANSFTLGPGPSGRGAVGFVGGVVERKIPNGIYIV